MIDEQILPGRALNRHGNAVTVTRTKDQRPQDQHVEGSLKQRHRDFVRHVW
jgi:hypothetical protein